MPNPHSSNVSQAVHQELQTTFKKKTATMLFKLTLNKDSCYIIILINKNKLNYLDDMIPEINFFPFFSGSIFNIKYANEISSPTTQNSIKQLK